LQDLFLKIHTHIDTLRTHDRLTSLIYQIARNAIADYFRPQRPTAELAETLSAAEVLVGDDVVHELSPCVAVMVATGSQSNRNVRSSILYDRDDRSTPYHRLRARPRVPK
jgi:DNA-directed RNA polymerase specialized sigma24 family protein